MTRTAAVVAVYAVVFLGALPTLLWVGGGWLQEWLGVRRFEAVPWLVLPGAGVAIAGTALMAWAMWLLRVDGEGWPISHLPPRRLVRRGPYAWMRHPIYVGYTLAFAGAALADGAPARFLGSSLVLILGWMAYARFMEEPRLLGRHGHAAVAYREDTPFLPGRHPRPPERLPDARSASRPAGADRSLLAARGLRKRYGRRQVLDDAGLAIGAEEVVGIAGENGAGKSTLVRILAGVLRPDSGEVVRGGRIGYAPQEPLLYAQLTPWDHFRYFAAARGLAADVWQSRAEQLLGIYAFERWRADRAANLSGGTRQKLNLALALLPDPDLLLLDEPYGGFDLETYERFWAHIEELRRRGRSLVIVSHLFHERDRFDRLLHLRAGRLEEER